MAKKKNHIDPFIPDQPVVPEPAPDQVPDPEPFVVPAPEPDRNPHPLPTADPIAGLAPREAVHLFSSDRKFQRTVPFKKNAQYHQIGIDGAAYHHFGADQTGRWEYEQVK